MKLTFQVLVATTAITAGLTTAPARGATTYYSSSASFNAATLNRVSYNFEGIVPAGSATYIPGSLTVGPVTFTSNGNLFVIDKNGGFGNYGVSKFDANIAPPTPLAINVSVTGGFTAFSFTVGSYIGIFGVDVRVNGTDVYSFTTPGNPGVGTTFVGATSTTPITSISFTTTSNPLNNSVGNYSGLDITAFQSGTAITAPIPEVGTLWLLLAGLGAVAIKSRAMVF